MLNHTVLWQQWEGRIVPRAFSAGYVVLSYVVSYVGAWTTLELINRKTSGRGLYNWYLLVGSSVSMGGIAIWCMHFISNRAIVLGNAQFAIQIAYSLRYTVMSFFVPITVLLVAFIALEPHDRVSIIRVTIGGTLAGLAICGMHYLGQAGISNYTSVYNVGNVVGSVVIAIAASIVALSLFFVFRAAWINSWWKRALCAVILASAVFGMHWTASIGTQYRLKQGDASLPYSISRDLTVRVVIVLSITACFILLVFAILAQRRRLLSANRAQHVVLAAAVFDKYGRLLVTPEGLLPNQTVTTSYVERAFAEEFGVAHPVFQWIFRATRNWSSISSLLPGIRNHLYRTSIRREPRPALISEANLGNNDSEPTEDYSIIFRELFCIAAADLAEQLNEPLENIGILFDEIYETGRHTPSKWKAQWNSPESADNLESHGTAMLGSGQLLFLVSRASRRKAERLTASGYRFADIPNVAHIIVRNMQIKCDDFQGRLSNMCAYSSDAYILSPGVHVACFAIRATVWGSFDVIVCKDARNQLPTTKLPIDGLNNWEIAYLSRLDGSSVTACLGFLKEKSASSDITQKEQSFTTQLYDALLGLKEEINDPFFADALLIGRPISAPCYKSGRNAEPAQATLIAFRIIVPIQFRAQGLKLGFTPLNFFRTLQYVHRHSPDHTRFARKIHKEFGPILNRGRLSIKEDTKALKPPKFPRKFSKRLKRNLRGPLDGLMPAGVPKAHTMTQRLRLWNRPSGGEPRALPLTTMGSVSEVQLVEARSFGGIMVDQEVSVDIRDIKELSRGGDDAESGRTDAGGMEFMRMGTTSMAMKEVNDSETYVDILLAISIAAIR
ncbi:hypothetical protein B0O99DRAFT_503943 [Bisporella sp. PMI_857]|nr:hypothetical protein B0O99DRAFT_503943 [Bisporella sp. PMI_857]